MVKPRICLPVLCLVLVWTVFDLSADLTSSLIAYYPLDGDAMDATGNGHNGTLMGNPQFMPLAYGDGGAQISETTRHFESPWDWSAHGIQSLSLFFQGSAFNQPGRLYVKVNDREVPYPGDQTDL